MTNSRSGLDSPRELAEICLGSVGGHPRAFAEALLQSSLMSQPSPASDRVLEEVRFLRDELRVLSRRVDQLSDHVSSQGNSVINSPGPAEGQDQGYFGGLFVAPPIEGELDFPTEGLGSEQLPATPVVNRPVDHTWPEREEVARGIGRFFVRALEGRHRGNSGRDRVALSSRLYVVIRNRAGLVTTDPVRVLYRFSEVKAICAQGGDFGDSIFCGFPSLREARCAVAAAGFAWPEGH